MIEGVEHLYCQQTNLPIIAKEDLFKEIYRLVMIFQMQAFILILSNFNIFFKDIKQLQSLGADDQIYYYSCKKSVMNVNYL